MTETPEPKRSRSSAAPAPAATPRQQPSGETMAVLPLRDIVVSSRT